MAERLFPQERHDSMRGHFAAELYERMAEDEKIWLVTCDLGYKMFDHHLNDFPERTINVGASEQAGVGIGVGLALEGKIPVVYSITNFILYRPFEFIRNYLDYEKIPVKLVGAGRDLDYAHDGYTHHSQDAKKVLECFPNVEQFFPEGKEEMKEVMDKMLYNNKPSFLSLRR
jgi:transketolase